MILRFFLVLLLMPIYAIVIVFIYTELSELLFQGKNRLTFSSLCLHR